MRYDMRRPCDNCPFLREGGIRLTRGRAREIAGMMIAGGPGDFPCHKTTIDVEDGDGTCDRAATPDSKHCAGALIFAEKNGTATQMMRICERLGMYDASKLIGQELVFDDIDEMMDTAVGAPRCRRRGRER